jgi:hypothetical protein
VNQGALNQTRDKACTSSSAAHHVQKRRTGVGLMTVGPEEEKSTFSWLSGNAVSNWSQLRRVTWQTREGMMCAGGQEMARCANVRAERLRGEWAGHAKAEGTHPPPCSIHLLR